MQYVHKLNDGKTHNGIDEEFVEFLMSRSGETFDQMTDILHAKAEAQPFFRLNHTTYGWRWF